MCSATVKLKKLNVGCLNVFHLQNKLSDISNRINQTEQFHLFGLSETRLNSNVSDDFISIPNFSVVRRDAG